MLTEQLNAPDPLTQEQHASEAVNATILEIIAGGTVMTNNI